MNLDNLNDIFLSTVRKHVKNEQVFRSPRVIILPDSSSNVFQMVSTTKSGLETSTFLLDHYCDWENVERDDEFEEKSQSLARGCAGAYNCLVQSAIHKYHGSAVITDLYSSLKFMAVRSDPNTDPAQRFIGWVSYKFKFGCVETRL